MAYCKTAATPLLMQWCYCSFALSHRYEGTKNRWQNDDACTWEICKFEAHATKYWNLIIYIAEQIQSQCQKLGKLFTGLTYKLLSSFIVISHVYSSLIQNKTTFTKYCLTQWISKLPRSFEIHQVRQYLVNITGMAGIANTTVDRSEPIFTGLGLGKLS